MGSSDSALAYGPCFSALLELALRYIGCYYSRLEETYMLAWLFPCNTKRVTQLVWFWFCSDSCACEDTINARVYKWMKGASGKRAVPILFVWERLAGSLFQAPSAQRIDFLESLDFLTLSRASINHTFTRLSLIAFYELLFRARARTSNFELIPRTFTMAAQNPRKQRPQHRLLVLLRQRLKRLQSVLLPPLVAALLWFNLPKKKRKKKKRRTKR